EDHQSELANLDLVSAPELRFVDAFPVDVGAVEATHIADTERAASPVELYVPPGDRHVVQEDIAVRVPSRRGEVLVQQETAPRVRTAFHDEQGSPRGQGFHRGRIRADGVDAVGFSLQRLDAAERNRGRRLADAVAATRLRVIPSRPVDGGTAVGAEAGIIRNGVTALRAVRHRSARPPTARGGP